VDFAVLKQLHSDIDKSRVNAIDGAILLIDASELAKKAGNVELAAALRKIGRDALALDFVIPRPKG